MASTPLADNDSTCWISFPIRSPMGMRRGPKLWLWPSWVETVGAMAAADAMVSVSCDGCRQVRDVDIPALLAKVGPDYSLINRRCRCRITPGCMGWNRFRYVHGVSRRLWDDVTADRWICGR